MCGCACTCICVGVGGWVLGGSFRQVLTLCQSGLRVICLTPVHFQVYIKNNTYLFDVQF